jgi:hypothetical protein
MMIVRKKNVERLNDAYEDFFNLFERHNLTPEETFGLLITLTVQIAGDVPKEDMMATISQVYDHDRAVRLSSKEVH